jgi:hypothetical protein
MTDQTMPPIVPEQDFSSVMALIELLADPAAAKAHIADLMAQQALLKELTDTLNEARAEHEQARVSIVTAEAAAKTRIAAENSAHVEACAERERALNVRESQIARREVETKADREAAQTLKQTLERRLAAVNAAARDAAA